MAKNKWITLKENDELRDRAIVTRKIIGQKGKKLFDVTIGLPGWSLRNNTIAYMPLLNITEAPEAWKSEYKGDEFPSENISCMAQLQGTQSYNEGKLKIVESYYLAKEYKFLRIPDGWEVIGWSEFPKPFTKKN